MECSPMPRLSLLRTPACIGVAAALLSLGTPGAATAIRAGAPHPQRIVSLNLCADQYLLALADPGQIAGLTHNAIDPALSAAAGAARGMHIMGESAEEVLALDPDLIVGAPPPTLSMLARQHYRIIDLAPAASYADIVAQIRMVAAAIGQSARGEALIARVDRALADIPRRADGPSAAYYQRRGYLTGTGTLVDDLMRRVGLRNLARTLGKPALSQLSLEELVAARPDYLIVESDSARVTDQGTEMLRHPILDGIPRLYLPQAWTVCGGPAYVLAARSLARQLGAREGRGKSRRASSASRPARPRPPS
jgi:iron complex transport system substrate-binding protein